VVASTAPVHRIIKKCYVLYYLVKVPPESRPNGKQVSLNDLNIDHKVLPDNFHPVEVDERAQVIIDLSQREYSYPAPEKKEDENQ